MRLSPPHAGPYLGRGLGLSGDPSPMAKSSDPPPVPAASWDRADLSPGLRGEDARLPALSWLGSGRAGAWQEPVYLCECARLSSAHTRVHSRAGRAHVAPGRELHERRGSAQGWSLSHPLPPAMWGQEVGTDSRAERFSCREAESVTPRCSKGGCSPRACPWRAELTPQGAHWRTAAHGG